MLASGSPKHILPNMTTHRISLILLLLLGVAPSLRAAESFKKTVKLHGITFTVESPNKNSGNAITIAPSGLKESNQVVKIPVNGRLTAVQVGDIDQDGSPEVYASISERNGQGSLVAYAANRKRSLSQIYVPPLAGIRGYAGRDVFRVRDRSVLRTFDLRDGGTGEVQYRLRAGEAGWKLEPAGSPPPSRPKADQPPEIRVRANGDMEVLMPAGGVLLYNRRGQLIQKGSTVSQADLERANIAVRAYLKEQ